MLIDTHCHIHQSDYPLDKEETLSRAHDAGVMKMICVGTDEASSREALAFSTEHKNTLAAVGVHPHEAKGGWEGIAGFAAQKQSRLVAVGEIGLDYHYSHSPRVRQIEALQAQIDIALTHNLPVIFHIREAFDDFWPIIDGFHGLRGVLHSYTDTIKNLEEGLKRGLFIGVNGISTFTKDEAQQKMFQAVPLNRLLLETDAPYLTPVPFRGKVNEPAYVRDVAEHQAHIRNMLLDDIAAHSTANAEALFAI